jgi:hypothetical protein
MLQSGDACSVRMQEALRNQQLDFSEVLGLLGIAMELFNKINTDSAAPTLASACVRKSPKRFFDKLVNHFAALWRNLQKRKLILHNNYLLNTNYKS